jgi:O-phosphoseryl-tRNA synthetase
MGFEEILLPVIVDYKEVLRQFGPEGNLILDRVFYLAGLPRPDLGVSEETKQQILTIVPGFNGIDALKNILRKYKKGDVEADDLVETLVTQLNISEPDATRIINLFPEFKQMKPIPMDLSLRSHTTTVWYPVLKHIKNRQILPIQLFSIGQKFRREQKLDATHLYESWTASIVIMSEDMSLEDGQSIVNDIFQELGYQSVDFRIKKGTSKYYAPQTEFEVFIRQPTIEEYLEVGDGGFYSPISLAQYNIEYPVFNFGFGLERLVMIKTGIPDIRQLVYPYLYTEIEFSDMQIAQNLELKKKPSPAGVPLVQTLLKKAKACANIVTPCQIIIFDGEFLGKRVVIKILEKEEGKKLLGAAAFNPLIVKNSEIIGARPTDIPIDSVRTGYTYMDGIANQVVYQIERAVNKGKGELNMRFGMVRRLSDVNFNISDSVRRYIESQNSKIDIRGPVFAEFQIEILDTT